MRRILLLLLLLMFPILTHAQTSRFDCESGERYAMQLALSTPTIAEESFSEYIVTVIGLGGFNPVIAIDAPEIPQYCNVGFEEAAFYQLTLPDAPEIPEIVNTAQDYVSIPGENTIQIGEARNDAGEFLVVIEGNFNPDTASSDTFTLPLTDAMLSNAITPTAYLFALTEDFAPTLTITSAAGETTEAQILEESVQLASDIGITESAQAIPLGTEAGDVNITVGSNNGEGIYALVLHVKTGEAIPGDGTAQVTVGDDGVLTLACDEVTVSENATRITLPPNETDYTVTAVGLVSFDPILAIVDEAGNGTCFNDSESALGYAATLPTIAVEGSIFSVQVVADSETRQIVIGSGGEDSGEYLIMIEGGNLAPEEADTFGVYITPAMINVSDNITAYTIAADDALNPVLSYVNRTGAVIADDEGLPYQCDDAGIPDLCYGSAPSMRDYTLMLADNQTLTAFEVDALLQLPINDTLTGATFNVQVTGKDETSGTYVFVLHIITE